MGRRSKKSKASKKSAGQSGARKQYSMMENIIYYALAVVGVLVLVSVIIWLLGYFKIL